MKIVLANGVFDILHVGHVEHLEEASGMGSLLIVALTVDECVGKGPGRPIYGWNDRARVLKALSFVDQVVPCRSAVEAIRSVRPAIFVKGIDYAQGNRWTEDVKGACEEVGAALRFTTTRKRSATDAILRTVEIELGND